MRSPCLLWSSSWRRADVLQAAAWAIGEIGVQTLPKILLAAWQFGRLDASREVGLWSLIVPLSEQMKCKASLLFLILGRLEAQSVGRWSYDGAVYWLRYVRNPDAVSVLQAALTHCERSVRLNAAAALCTLCPESALGTLLALIDDAGNKEIQLEAAGFVVQALSKVRDTGLLDA